MKILKTIPFDKVDIKVINVEVNHLDRIFPGSFEELESFLNEYGYRWHSLVKQQDAIFIRRDFEDSLMEKSEL